MKKLIFLLFGVVRVKKDYITIILLSALFISIILLGSSVFINKEVTNNVITDFNKSSQGHAKENNNLLKVDHFTSHILSMEGANNTTVKGVEYIFYLYSKKEIVPKNYSFKLENTPLKNPYSIQDLSLQKSKAGGFLYELKISTMYDPFYTDENLKELKRNPGFNIIMDFKGIEYPIF